MKKFSFYGLTLTAGLLASTAIAQVVIDKSKWREWNGGLLSTEQEQTMAQRKADARASETKFKNVVRSNAKMRIASTNPDILPNDVIDDGTRINFQIAYWFMGDFIGIGSCRPVAGTPLESVLSSQAIPANSIYANGKLYCVNYMAGGGQVISARYQVIDLASGKLESEIELPAQWYSVWDLGAYNAANGKIYLIGYDGHRIPYLSELDTDTGTYTQLVYCPVEAQALAFDAEGKLFAITRAGELEQIDLSTGEGTPLFRIEDEGVQCLYWHSLAFDHHTGELFWIRNDNNFQVDLRKIDIVAQTVEVVSDLPDFGAVNAWVESPKAEALSPSTVEELFVEFGDNGSHVGTINVTAPSKTFDGSSLEGEVKVAVSVADNKVGELTLSPGESAKIADIDFGSAGEHKVVTVASNAVGDGPKGSIIAYCGPDTPASASDVTLAVAADGTSTLSWTAPTEGIHQGYFNADLLSYDIVRLPDDVVVATDLTANTFSESLPNLLARYSYKVTAKCDGIPAEAVESNSIVFGDGLSIPLDTQLGGEEFYNLCTVYDLDNDGNTWYETWGSTSCYTGWNETVHQSDDWLITPPVALEPGNYYVETSFEGIGGVSSFDFTFGTSQLPSDHNAIQSFANIDYNSGEQIYRSYVTAKEEGKYYFGYHYTSSNGQNADVPYLSIRRLKVAQGPADGAPEAVTNLSAVPGENGALETIISFTTPVTTFVGDKLDALTLVEICDASDEVIESVSPVEPGKTYEFVHKGAVTGYNSYHVYALNDSGRGKLAETEVYAGDDLADLVEWLDYSVVDNRVVNFEWGLPPTLGVRGGYVNPETLTYNFCRSEYDWLEPFSSPETEGLKERKLTWTECGPNATFGSAQHLYFYGIKAVTPVGEGRLGYTGIVLGDPNQTPFIESFAGGYNNTAGVWANQLISGVAGWSVSTGSDDMGITPSDNDSGMLLFSPEDESIQAINLPLIEIKDMKKPVVAFDMYHKSGADADAYLSVQISQNDANYEPIGFFNAKADNDGWTEHKLSLDNYNDCDRNFIAFLGVGYGKNSTFAIDNIRICDDVEYDVAIENLSGPATMDLGETGSFKVMAKGMGMKTVEEFGVDIYADDILMASTTGMQLAQGATVELNIQVPTNAANGNKYVNYEARVSLASDGNDNNDIASTTVFVGGSELPAPRQLVGAPEGDEIILSWEAPDAPVSEMAALGFEDWTSFAIEGENGWKFYDGDRLSPFGIGGLTYPNMDKGRAWMVWAPGELDNFNDKAWYPNDGSKCLIAFASSFYTMEGDFDFGQQSDEWLISPHVVGGTELKFSVGVPAEGTTERFEVMISYGGRNPEDFTKLGETVVLNETGWKEFSYTLPTDVAYFAIHYVSLGYEAFALMVDNIEFTAGYDEVELLGYNVYVNGMLVNDNPVEDLSARAPYSTVTDNTYGVSALYYEGESNMIAVDFLSGVDNVAFAGIKVYAGKGEIAIVGNASLSVKVFNTAGVVVASLTTSGYDVISLPNGVYVVTVDGKPFKVVVK